MLGELDDRAIEQLLQSEFVARIACYADDKLYVVPVTYAIQGKTESTL
jgi:nitroimidazol reductase NimA-like FMN-containing flavoprotein (pyridoxamine 5'-phosphate oxidase superfamily)